MHLTLLVPGLLWPREILRDMSFDLPLPALSLLLGRGTRTALPNVETWLAEAFGMPTPLPWAPLRLLGDGGAPDADNWLCLDPVHLRVEEHAMIVDDPAALALSVSEDAELRSTISPLLDGIGEIVAPAPGRWHVRLHQAIAIESRPLPEAVGRASPHEVPGGPNGARWRQLLSEAQTLLHAHTINRRREDAGQATVNSLWPWGQGRLVAPNGLTSYDAVCTDDPVLKGLGLAIGAELSPLPSAYDTGRKNILARLDSLVAPAARFDALAWREELLRIEADWLAPALAAIASGHCRSLHVVAAGDGRAMQIALVRHQLWRFWRKPAALAELLP